MIIGYDGKRAVENNTGLGNYSRLLVDQLATRFPENTYRLYAPHIRPNPRMQNMLLNRNVTIVTPDRPGWQMLPSLWRSKGMTDSLIEDKVDLFHGLSGELPFNIDNLHKPTVLTVHDVIFRRFPQYYAAIDRKIYDQKFSRSCHKATRVIAISECTKRDIMEFYDVPEEKIDVIYQGCHSQFQRTPSPEEIRQVKTKYGVNGPYIITVGTVETRKNQAIAMRGMYGLPAELSLVIVGRRTGYARILDRYISTYKLGNRIKFIENVDFADLPALYAGAFCSSYTSRYEGFGIPVIESLSSGCPVIVASGSCLEEAGGPGAPSIDPDDIEQWISIVKEFIDYPEYRRKAIRDGRKYVERFNNSDMAANVMNTYLRAIKEYRG